MNFHLLVQQLCYNSLFSSYGHDETHVNEKTNRNVTLTSYTITLSDEKNKIKAKRK